MYKILRQPLNPFFTSALYVCGELYAAVKPDGTVCRFSDEWYTQSSRLLRELTGRGAFSQKMFFSIPKEV